MWEVALTTHESYQVDLVRRVCHYIDANVDCTLTLDALSEHVNMSPFHLQRTFKRMTGVTPRQYADARRLKHFKARLRQQDNVTDALYDAGYSSSSRVYERAPEHLGMTPAVYSKGGAGMHIFYTIVECPLGYLLIGRTERGLCAVHVGRNEEELEQALLNEYPFATLERHHSYLYDWVTQFIAHVNGWLPHLELPMDIRATAFQRRVWEELRKIPYGETRTYQQIAEAIGQPKAASAVAKACAENPLALIIPCHRVSREDGEVTTFYSEREIVAWERMLENEQEKAQK